MATFAEQLAQEDQRTQKATGPTKNPGDYMWDQLKGSFGLGPQVNPADYGKSGVPVMERILSKANAAIPLGDELVDSLSAGVDAAVQGKSFGDAWKAKRAQSKALNADTQKNHPWLNAGAEMLPAIVTAGAGPSAFESVAPVADTGLFGGFQMGNTAKPLAGEGPISGLARKGANVARKGVLGGLAAYTSGLAGEGDFGKRLSDAESMTLPGVLSGIAIPTLLETGAKVVNSARRNIPDAWAAVTGNPRMTQVGDEMLPARSAAKAGRVLANRVPGAADPTIGPTAANQLPFEQWGQGGQSVARAVGAVPGPGKQLGEDAFLARRKGAVGRMEAAVKDATGASGQDFYPVQRTAEAMRSAQSDPLYKEANETPINATDYARELGPLLESDYGQQALAIARKLAFGREAVSGQSQGWPQNILDDQGKISGVEVPNSNTLDTITQGWDDLLKPYRDEHGNLTKLDNEGRLIRDMRDQFVSKVGGLVPKNAEARQMWAGGTSPIEAMGYGRKAVGAQWDPELIQERNARLSPEAIEGQRVGVARGVSDKLWGDNPRAAIRSMATTPNTQMRLRAAMGPEDDPAAQAAWERLHGQATEEAGHEQSFANTMQGSRTTPLSQDVASTNEAAEEQPGVGAMAAEALAKKAGGKGFIRQGFEAGAAWKRRQGAALNDPVVSRLLGEVLYKGRNPQEVLDAAVKQQLIRPQDVKNLSPILSSAAGFRQKPAPDQTPQERF